MEHHTTYIETDQKLLLDRMLQRAANLWGIDSMADLDPLIQLLLEVLGYEVAGLSQSVLGFQKRVLEELAGTLLEDRWRLPVPAYALMTAQPLDQHTHISPDHQFYTQVRSTQLDGNPVFQDQHFSPMISFPLLKGELRLVIGKFGVLKGAPFSQSIAPSSKQVKGLSSQEIWLGLALAPELKTIDQIGISIALHATDWRLNSRLSACQFFLEDGQPLLVQKVRDSEEEQASKHKARQLPHLAKPGEMLLGSLYTAFENNHLIISAQKSPIRIKTNRLPPGMEFSREEELFQEELFWLKVRFPPAFREDQIRRAQVRINAFPVVNRKLNSLKIRLERGSQLVRLGIAQGSTLMGIRSIKDDVGRSYRQKIRGMNDIREGYYAIRNAHLERIDKQTARDRLSQVIRLVREEASLFSPLGLEIMLKQLNDLNQNLDDIERQVARSTFGKPEDRHYLLVNPLTVPSQLEISYWTIPEAWEYTRITAGMPLQQYRGITVQAGSCRFLSPIVPGKPPPAKDVQSGLVMGNLLSRGKVVTKSDVKAFVVRSLGAWAQTVEVANGIAVSAEPKRGLVRTIDIKVQASPNCPLDPGNWADLLAGLSAELNRNSIQTAEYRLQLSTPIT